jgi:Predicted thioesterase involved in non-ribosomal peptide biosynthesis
MRKPAFRLICIPCAGGSASYFLKWASVFPPQVKLHGLHLPGREERFDEPLPISLTELTARLVDEIQPLFDLPFAIFGHSIGALVGFELARHLRRKHLPQPALLIASGLRAPHLISTLKPATELQEHDFLHWLAQLNGTPRNLLADDDAIRVFLPVIRADMMLATSYLYEAEPALRCSLSAYGGLSDAGTDRQQLLGWKQHTAGKFRLRMFPGGHFFTDTVRALVCESILTDIAEACEEGGAACFR